jgi:MarR family 2-MHQ and catechol resistance regulon transcriptional repressor
MSFDQTVLSPSPNFSSSAEGAFRSLVRTFGLMKRVMEPYFARFGISGSQWSVLRTLHRCAQEGTAELRLTDLGDRLIVRPASVTGVVDKLVRMGLIERKASPSDQRVKHVSLTHAGEQFVARVLRHHPQQIESVLSGLGVEEQRELQRLLEKLEPHLTQLADGCVYVNDEAEVA